MGDEVGQHLQLHRQGSAGAGWCPTVRQMSSRFLPRIIRSHRDIGMYLAGKYNCILDCRGMDLIMATFVTGFGAVMLLSGGCNDASGDVDSGTGTYHGASNSSR